MKRVVLARFGMLALFALFVLFVLFVLLQVPSAFAQVQISEVLYDPVSTESGGEAVELYNPETSPVDISGWIIRTESSATDATIPSGTIIQPESYYLIADAGFSENKDNPSMPDADYEEAITLANTDAGLALISNGTTIDAVGWGTAANIDAGLFEGSPHTGTSSGESLQRTQETQDNSQDFIAAAPSLQGSSYAPSNSIQFTVIVTQSAPSIGGIQINIDDDTAPGIQVAPQPKGKKQIPLAVIVNDNQGPGNIKSVTATLGDNIVNLTNTSGINSTASRYEGFAEIDFFEDPGICTIMVEAENLAGISDSGSVDFEYLSLIGLEIDSQALSCSADSGQSCDILGDADINTTGSVTIRNIGNVVIDSEIYGTDLNSGSAVIPVNNVKYSFSTDLSTPQTLTSSPTSNLIGLPQGVLSTKGLSFGVTIPSSTPAGDYIGTISLVAVQS